MLSVIFESTNDPLCVNSFTKHARVENPITCLAPMHREVGVFLDPSFSENTSGIVRTMEIVVASSNQSRALCMDHCSDRHVGSGGFLASIFRCILQKRFPYMDTNRASPTSLASEG